MTPIRVLIVEDSAVVSEHLRRIITADGRFEVVGIAANGEQAVQAVESLTPDVITMDVHLPGMLGFEATRRIMALHPTPIIIVSGAEMKGVDLTLEASKAGALCVVEKPVFTGHPAYEAMAQRLCTQLAIMSEVKVVRRREAGEMRHVRGHAVNGRASGWRLLAIGASTGGPNALAELLSGLGPGFPLPIMIVQHMTPAFIDGFAQWLSCVTNLPVSPVSEPIPLEPRRVYVAARESHLVVSGDSASLDDGPPVNGHRPAVNVLFSSAARRFGASTIGVLLTGMGDDGAAGLREIKIAGGFTIAEAESTAIIYGMPAVAASLGAVCESLPLSDISGRILELLVGKELP